MRLTLNSANSTTPAVVLEPAAMFVDLLSIQ
jgi:hypothetical protein